MKKILVSALILLIALITWRLGSTLASLNDTSTTRVSVAAASLNLKLNGDNNSSLELNLGEVMPGNSGRVDLTINNEGSIPGSLCVTTGKTSPAFTVQSSSVCDVVIEPGGSTQFVIDWALPIKTHNTGLGGEFNFSFTFVLTNGYRVTKNVILKGTIFDPTDTPTVTPTETATPAPTDTPVPTDEPTATEAPMTTLTATSTATATNTATDTLIPPTATETATETPMPAATNTPLPAATNTLVPTDTETPTETPTP